MSRAQDRSLKNYLCASSGWSLWKVQAEKVGEEQGGWMSTGTNDQETSQQLKQAKLAIVELYQENRELRQQLATKTMKHQQHKVAKGT
jgi:enterochelin esterase-like enzyme